jgi:hypothetical protein
MIVPAQIDHSVTDRDYANCRTQKQQTDAATPAWVC